jgi:amino-acid N-acetyltransferase
LSELEKEVKQLGIDKIFVLTTQTAHWFLEQGFVEAEISDLPIERQSLYNLQRNSKVFFKTI